MAIKKRTHPKFLRPNFGRSSRSRIKAAWRRPRGIDNKKRMKIAYMGCSPSIGYGQPTAIKHFHPAGLPEQLVQSPSELSGLKNVLVRIASSVGRKKRLIIERLAKEAKLRVLNPVHERARDKRRKEEKISAAAKLQKEKAKGDKPKAPEAKAAPAEQKPAQKPAEKKTEQKPEQKAEQKTEQKKQ